MKMKKTGIIAIVGGFVVLLVVSIIISLSVYSGSRTSRVGLLTSYFRALAADDSIGLAELTAPGFFSDLLLPSLEPGSYELFDFGESGGPDSMVQRFLIIVDSGNEGKTAYLADMEYQRKMLGTDIQAIRSIGKGLPVKP
jgi:hypothetical protein